MIWAGYLVYMSQPKKTPIRSYEAQQTLDQSNQPRIEFVKKYFEAIRNGDKAKVREWSVSQLDYSSGDQKYSIFEKYWAEYAGRNFVFSKVVDPNEYNTSCGVIEVKENEKKYWFCVDGQPESGYKLVTDPESVKLSRLEQRSVNSSLGMDLNLARKGFAEQYFQALVNRDVPVLKKLVPSDFDTPSKDKEMGEAVERFFSRFWETSGGKTGFIGKIINGKLLECNKAVFSTQSMANYEQSFFSFCIKDIDPNNGLFSIDIIAEPLKENITREQLRSEYERINKN